jgi:hypothetical protein
MSTQSIKNEFNEFVQFATCQIELGGAESIEALVRQWRTDAEYVAAVNDIRQGILDDKSGKAEPVAGVFSGIRRELGLAN